MHQPLRLSVARLWFRRWSRSRAAVFHSLGTAVMIGRLSSSVLDSLARKSRTLAVESEARGEVSYQAKHEGEDEEPLFYTTVYNWQALYTPALGLSNNQHSASSISMIDDAYITIVKGLYQNSFWYSPF
ncbi:hypothetical protein [Porphyromonas sp. COT-290 OH3588]|uniref:hypothetical protein n=1 Tax=Porphyromonas sp. COT-290 OH3588 TaxID=1515617 RepID=UPI00126A18D7|nr:hypothetical protein [Porphyromonas sp. COT-290 OH3588]